MCLRTRESPEPASLTEIRIADKRLKSPESQYGDYKLVLVTEMSEIQLTA